MSFLTPLYILGLAAISLPILFHLIRRTPKGAVQFSSLMFVVPTPPRLTRRSRLDQILLLLLRALAVLLLALAFARPFWRGAALLDESAVHGRWIAMLIDTSASMRRDGIWSGVEQEVARVTADLGPNDRVAVYTFDSSVERVVGFEETQSLQVSARRQLVKQRVDQIRPGWGASELGNALIRAAGDLEAGVDREQPLADRRAVVISDFQEGCRIETLQLFQWPETVNVVVRRVTPSTNGNATLRLLEMSEESADQRGPRVLVANASDSEQKRFEIGWADAEGRPLSDAVGVNVPPGETRVARIPRLAEQRAATRLTLAGDDHEYDNSHFVVPLRKREVVVGFGGSEAPDDAEQMRFYLDNVLTNNRWRSTRVAPLDDALSPSDGGDQPELVVITESLPSDTVERVSQYLDGGGTVLYVVKRDAQAATTLGRLMMLESLDIEEVEPADYVMFGEIDFNHYLFDVFANPLYSDFTKIHFWRYRRLTLPDGVKANVPVKFDSGDPALVEYSRGKGRLFALMSGWHPDDGQLARSSKFVVILNRLIDYRQVEGRTRYLVNQTASIPDGSDNQETSVQKPDGTVVLMSGDRQAFASTDMPGLYQVRRADEDYAFAVNVDPAEANTAPLDVAQLEQRGVQVGNGKSRAEELESLRQLRDAELEGEQSYWQWLIAAALMLLIIETTIAGRWSKAVAETAPVGAS